MQIFPCWRKEENTRAREKKKKTGKKETNKRRFRQKRILCFRLSTVMIFGIIGVKREQKCANAEILLMEEKYLKVHITREESKRRKKKISHESTLFFSYRISPLSIVSNLVWKFPQLEFNFPCVLCTEHKRTFSLKFLSFSHFIFVFSRFLFSCYARQTLSICKLLQIFNVSNLSPFQTAFHC